MNLIRPFRRLALALLALAAAVLSGTARADMLGYSSAGGSADTNTAYTFGFGFTSANAIQITALGVYDNNDDGLSTARTVGLWRASDMALLASIVVPAGTAGTLVGDFRFLTLGSTVTLAAGTNYVLGVEYAQGAGGGDKIFNPTQTPATGITLSGTTLYTVSSSALTYPTSSLPNPRSTGNFLFTAAVPEPSTWAMMGVGAGLLGVGVLRRRRPRAA